MVASEGALCTPYSLQLFQAAQHAHGSHVDVVVIVVVARL